MFAGMYKCLASETCDSEFTTEEERRTHYEREHYDIYDYCPKCLTVYKRGPRRAQSTSLLLEKHLRAHFTDSDMEIVHEEYISERRNGRIPRFVATSPDDLQQYYDPRLAGENQGGPSEDHQQAAAPNLLSNVNIPGTSQNDSRPSAPQIQNTQQQQSAENQQGTSQPPIPALKREHMCFAPDCNNQFKTKAERRTHYEHFHKVTFFFCPKCVFAYRVVRGSTYLKIHIIINHRDIDWATVFAEYGRAHRSGRIPRFLATAPNAKQQYYKPPPVPQLAVGNQAGPREGHRQDAAPNLPSNVDTAGTSQNDSRPSAPQIQNPNVPSTSQEHHRELQSAPGGQPTSNAQGLQLEHAQQQEVDGRRQGPSQPPLSEKDQM